jgi:hypothetical protein
VLFLPIFDVGGQKLGLVFPNDAFVDENFKNGVLLLIRSRKAVWMFFPPRINERVGRWDLRREKVLFFRWLVADLGRMSYNNVSEYLNYSG